MTCHCCNGEANKFGRFKNANRDVQRYRCTRCGKTFSEDQPLDGLRVGHNNAVQIVKLLCEGLGIRACSRLVGCHIHTVLSVLETVGQKCAALLDARIRDIVVGALQIDELWSKVGVKQARAKGDPERGDFYTFLALDARTKLILSHLSGKRDAVSTDIFVHDLAARIAGRVQITTDGWNAYPDTIRRYLLERLDYAVMRKKFATPIGVVEAARRYSPAPFIGVSVSVEAGNPRKDRICTSFVERANLSVRHFNKRFARLGMGWSRKLENHCHSVALFVAAHNFVKWHNTLGTTPAVGAQITDHVWSVEELIEEAAKCG